MTKKAIALVLVTACLAALPLTRAIAGSGEQCLSLLEEQLAALKARDWPRVLTVSQDWMRMMPACDAAGFHDWAEAAEGAALAMRYLEKYADALSMTDRCLERVPSAVGCWQEKGEDLRALGRLTEARDAFRHALRWATGDAARTAQEMLAGVEAVLARKARAVPALKVSLAGGGRTITLTGPVSEQTVADFKRAIEEKRPTLVQDGNLFDAETHEYVGPAPPSLSLEERVAAAPEPQQAPNFFEQFVKHPAGKGNVFDQFDTPTDPNKPITNAGPKINLFLLDSRGGSLSAAMAIGDAVRKADFTVIVDQNDECSSACVLILAAGVQRRVVGRIGIHRLSFQDDSQFGSLKGEEAATAYRQMSDKVREYLRRMGFEDGLYAAMLRVPSGEARYLTPSEVKDFGLEGDDPAFAEWMKARAIERQGREGYEVDQSFNAVFFACLNSGIDQSQCDRGIRSKFNSDLEQCAAANGGARAQCAREVGRRMSEAYRH